MRNLAPVFGWGGLNTKASTTGLPMLDCVTLQDMRVVGRDLIQRLGMADVGQLAGTTKGLDFTAASSDMCSNLIDTRVWALGLYWTVELAIQPDLTTGTPGIFVAGHTTPAMEVYITGGNLTSKIWDTNGDAVTTTIGAAAAETQTIQITRSAAALKIRLNNGTAVEDVLHATRSVRSPVGDLRVARDDAANYYDGTVDYLRVLGGVVRTHHRDRLVRLANPRAKHVLADYDFNVSAGALVYDRSRYENHLICTNVAAGDEVTSICHNPAPVRALSMFADQNGKKQLLMVAGGQYYLASVD